MELTRGTAICLVLLVTGLTEAVSAGPGGDVVYNFDDSSGLGRTFDGIGGISGGGATSKLLRNYPNESRSQILDYLFKPNFGASLHIFKVEIGGDSQSTDGTESSHMHSSDDENYQRGYEWWLMVEAKKRNPNIKLYALPWSFPGWLGEGTLNPFVNPNQTADYVCRWISGAKLHYNLSIDFIGIWNEKPWNDTYIKTLRNMLDERGFPDVLIIAPDIHHWDIADEILKDPALASAIHAIGSHYPGTIATDAAAQTGKQLWASEDYSTYDDEVGGGCWARILNQNFINGNITGTIAWNVVASYYNGFPWYAAGLTTAAEPWSGHFSVDSPIWVTAHTTQFTEAGWTYLKHGEGSGKLVGGGSYVALLSPDKTDLTIIIETMSHNQSICTRPPLDPYDVAPTQTMNIQLNGSMSNIPQLNVWFSQLSFRGAPSTMFQNKTSVKLTKGKARIELGVDQVLTLTTLTTGQKGHYPAPPASKPFPLPYKDNFDSYSLYSEPYNLAQQTGVYEVIDSGDPAHQMVARQVVRQTPVYWCPAYNAADNINKSISMIGDYSWTDIYVEVEARLGAEDGASGFFVAAGVQHAGCQSHNATGIFLFLNPAGRDFYVYGDLAMKKPLGPSNYVNVNVTGWNKLSLLVQGQNYVGAVNGDQMFNMTIPYKLNDNGFVAIGTDSYGIADFDNLYIDNASEGQRIMEQMKAKYFSQRGDTPYK